MYLGLNIDEILFEMVGIQSMNHRDMADMNCLVFFCWILSRFLGLCLLWKAVSQFDGFWHLASLVISIRIVMEYELIYVWGDS